MGTVVVKKEVIVWTNTGASLIFKGVTMFKYTTQGFEFDYFGMSTGQHRHAVFNNTSVAGYAVKDM